MDSLNNRINAGYYLHRKKLGEGGFGKVELATHLFTKQKVAVKIIDKSKMSDDFFETELHALKQLNHKKIPKFYQFIESHTTMKRASTSSTSSTASSKAGLVPLSQAVCTVAFVPSLVDQQQQPSPISVSSECNGHMASTQSSPAPPAASASNIPMASCKGNIVEVDVVTVGQFEPGYEESKPFSMNDFYKYSAKYRNANKPSTNSNKPSSHPPPPPLPPQTSNICNGMASMHLNGVSGVVATQSSSQVDDNLLRTSGSTAGVGGQWSR